jgi:hypothetical protein
MKARSMRKNRNYIGKIAESMFREDWLKLLKDRGKHPENFFKIFISVIFLFCFCLIMPAISYATSATITWNRNQEPDMAGYRIYYGTQEGQYTDSFTIFDSANEPLERSYVMDGLGEGMTYYISIKAFDLAGQESEYSEALSITVPGSQPSGDSPRWLELHLETYFTDAPSSKSNVYPRVAGDVNGDALDDLIVFGNDGTYVALSNGNGFDAPVMWIDNFAYRAGGWISQDKYPRTVADVNGDGLADIIGFGTKATYVALSNGNGFDWPTIWTTEFAYAAGWISQAKSPRIVLELDGNHKADVVGLLEEGTYVYIN